MPFGGWPSSRSSRSLFVGLIKVGHRERSSSSKMFGLCSWVSRIGIRSFRKSFHCILGILCWTHVDWVCQRVLLCFRFRMCCNYWRFCYKSSRLFLWMWIKILKILLGGLWKWEYWSIWLEFLISWHRLEIHVHRFTFLVSCLS